jgi:hypothetical protein
LPEQQRCLEVGKDVGLYDYFDDIGDILTELNANRHPEFVRGGKMKKVVTLLQKMTNTPPRIKPTDPLLDQKLRLNLLASILS